MPAQESRISYDGDYVYVSSGARVGLLLGEGNMGNEGLGSRVRTPLVMSGAYAQLLSASHTPQR